MGKSDFYKKFLFLLTAAVLLTTGVYLLLKHERAHPIVASADSPCFESLFQVKRGPSTYAAGAESPATLECPHPRHQLVPSDRSLLTVPGDGVYVCRCIDLHAVVTTQETRLDIAFERLKYLETRLQPAPAASAQAAETERRLDFLEHIYHGLPKNKP